MSEKQKIQKEPEDIRGEHSLRPMQAYGGVVDKAIEQYSDAGSRDNVVTGLMILEVRKTVWIKMDTYDMLSKNKFPLRIMNLKI